MPIKANPVIPRATLERMFDDRDFFLTLCTLLETKGVDLVGQKFMDYHAKHKITDADVEGRLDLISKAFTLLAVLGQTSIPLSFPDALPALVGDFSDEATTRTFMDNIDNGGVTFTNKEIVDAVRSCITGDWGEPGDIDIKTA